MVPQLSTVWFWSIFYLCEGERQPVTWVIGGSSWKSCFCQPLCFLSGSSRLPRLFTRLHLQIARAGHAAFCGTDGSRFPLGRAESVEQRETVIRKKCSWFVFFPPLEYLGYSISAWSEQREAFVVQIRGLPPLYFLFRPSLYSPKALLPFSRPHVKITLEEKMVCHEGIFGYCVKRQAGPFLCLVFFHWPQSELYLTVWQLIVPSFPFPKLISPSLSASIKPLCLRSS